MAWYNCKTNQIEHFKSERCEPPYTSWEQIDCGCCAGIEWGGDYPRECDRCGGSGVIYRHIKSGVLKDWPGGKFV